MGVVEVIWTKNIKRNSMIGKLSSNQGAEVSTKDNKDW